MLCTTVLLTEADKPLYTEELTYFTTGFLYLSTTDIFGLDLFSLAYAHHVNGIFPLVQTKTVPSCCTDLTNQLRTIALKSKLKFAPWFCSLRGSVCVSSIDTDTPKQASSADLLHSV